MPSVVSFLNNDRGEAPGGASPFEPQRSTRFFRTPDGTHPKGDRAHVRERNREEPGPPEFPPRVGLVRRRPRPVGCSGAGWPARSSPRRRKSRRIRSAARRKARRSCMRRRRREYASARSVATTCIGRVACGCVTTAATPTSEVRPPRVRRLSLTPGSEPGVFSSLPEAPHDASRQDDLHHRRQPASARPSPFVPPPTAPVSWSPPRRWRRTRRCRGPSTRRRARSRRPAAGAVAVAVDVRDRPRSPTRWRRPSRFGGIDVLVNNASAISLTGTAATPMKRFDLMHQVNARATFLCTQQRLRTCGAP